MSDERRLIKEGSGAPSLVPNSFRLVEHHVRFLTNHALTFFHKNNKSHAIAIAIVTPKLD